MECGVANSFYGELYNELFSPESENNILVKPAFAGAKEVIDAIHEADGIAILAHPALVGDAGLIAKYIEMGIDGIDMVKDHVKSDDMRSMLMSQREEYSEFFSEADAMLRKSGGDTEDVPVMAKVSTTVMGTVKNLIDRTDSQYAEDMMKGTQMGITKLIKHIHEYSGDEKDEALSLANKVLKAEERNIEQIKKYL